MTTSMAKNNAVTDDDEFFEGISKLAAMAEQSRIAASTLASQSAGDDTPQTLADAAAAIPLDSIDEVDVSGWSTDTEQYLRILHPDSLYEVRALDTPEPPGKSPYRSTGSGYFNDPHKAAQSVKSYNAVGAKGIYFTLNPVNPQLLSRSPNMMTFKARHTTTDAEILCLCWLFIDIDSLRPSGTNAKDAQHRHSLRIAKRIQRVLRALGWPEPILVSSGNGAYLLFKIDLANDQLSTDLISRCLQSLSKIFNDAKAEVDTSTFNASRLSRAVGTKNIKGHAAPELDIHQRIVCYRPPSEPPEVVTVDQLRWLAGQCDLVTPNDYSDITTATKQQSSSGQEIDRILLRASRYIDALPPAINGNHGHDTTFKAACKLFKLGLSIEQARPILERYNQRCEPPWSQAELEHKLTDAYEKVIADGEFGEMVKRETSQPVSQPAAAITAPSTFAAIEPGTKVKSLDWGNIGTVVADYGADCSVQFVSPEGNSATVDIPKNQLVRLDGKPLDPATVKPLEPIELCSFIAQNPEQSQIIIEGLLRRGEVMNVIGASKDGKSWLILGLLLCLASGRDWLGRTVKRSKVLLIDNELQPGGLADRVQQVMRVMELDSDDVRDWFFVKSLRGQLKPLTHLAPAVALEKPNNYEVIVLDAFYRLIPEGTSENDNAQMTLLYNQLDSLAGELNCGIILNHHSSKGDQSGKSVTDVGSGAGAISRAADTHMTIRPHTLDGHAVVDVACRSFPPNPQRTIRWEWPLWHPSDEAPSIRRNNASQGSGESQAEFDEMILELLAQGTATVSEMRTRIQVKADEKSPRNFNKIKNAMESLAKAGKIYQREIDGRGGKRIDEFSLPPE